MPVYNEHKLNGADSAFNRTWTLIARDEGNNSNWVFNCGCGEEKEFTNKQFLDPQEAAITYREFHRCAGSNDVDEGE